MGKFIFFLFLIFVVGFFWPKPPTPAEQRAQAINPKPAEPGLVQRFSAWLVENTPKK